MNQSQKRNRGFFKAPRNPFKLIMELLGCYNQIECRSNCEGVFLDMCSLQHSRDFRSYIKCLRLDSMCKSRCDQIQCSEDSPNISKLTASSNINEATNCNEILDAGTKCNRENIDERINHAGNPTHLDNPNIASEKNVVQNLIAEVVEKRQPATLHLLLRNQ